MPSLTRNGGLDVRSRILFLACTFWLMAEAAPVFAGGGPENVLLVVNSRSWSSQTIANYYRHLRGIPSSNVLMLDWGGSVDFTYVNNFRNQIFKPILEAIQNRHLAGQIDYVVYSSDFPYRVNFDSDMPRPVQFSTGALTGLTYLYDLVSAKRPEYSAQDANWYANTTTGPDSTTAFRNRYFWQRGGERTRKKGLKYMLSAMLGYTSGRGNSVPEVVSYLTRSIAADGTVAQGTVYYMTNPDIRSKARSGQFVPVQNALRREGIRTELREGTLPENRMDVLGVMTGTPFFEWHKSGSQILPGAFCENFTSFGGVLKDGSSQRPLTEFLRYGAAGSSGTVAEPYALTKKFPHASLFLHYGRGSSLAEAFYRSVHGPYQQLLVGDPLCQPWAKQAEIFVNGVKPNQTVSGQVKIRPKIASPSRFDVDSFSLYVDGRILMECEVDGSFPLNTRSLPDGYHELAIVATSNEPLETQARLVIPIRSNNYGRSVTCTITQKRITRDEDIELDVAVPGAERIEVSYNRVMVGSLDASQGTIRIPARRLGMGPVRLDVLGIINRKEKQAVFGKPVFALIRPSSPLAALPSAVGVTREPGFEFIVGRLPPSIVTDTKNGKWLTDAKLKAGDTYQIRGMLHARQKGVHQLQAQFNGDLKVFVDEHVVYQGRHAGYQRADVLLNLDQGWHPARIVGKMGNQASLEVAFGFRGAQFLGSYNMAHLR